MNIENLNQAFAEIAEKKSKLSQTESGSEERNLLAREISVLEDDFRLEYGSYLEEVLFNVYDEYCSDDQVQSLTSYFADTYQIHSKGTNLNFDVADDEGVEVHAEDFPGIQARLVLVPNPVRLILQGTREPFREVLWKMKEPLEA